LTTRIRFNPAALKEYRKAIRWKQSYGFDLRCATARDDWSDGVSPRYLMGRDKKVLSGPGRRDRPGPREAADGAGRQDSAPRGGSIAARCLGSLTMVGGAPFMLRTSAYSVGTPE